jgi:hypothetical protein
MDLGGQQFSDKLKKINLIFSLAQQVKQKIIPPLFLVAEQAPQYLHKFEQATVNTF